ncbi:MAG: DUF177 domain-containing protein [Clostridia bacterium]
MVIDFKKIRNAAEEKVDFDYNVDLSDVEHLLEKVFTEPVQIKGSITNHLGVIKLYAECHTTLSCSCGRCLQQIHPTHEVIIDNVLSTMPNEEDGDDTFVVLTDRLELDDIIIPAIILELEMSYLCDEDCKGLCPKCGTDLNAGKCSCDTRMIDPRLAALQQLLDKE